MRLDKYLNHTLCISRNDAHNIIRKKQISVNGRVVSSIIDVKEKTDIVTYNNVKITYKDYYYYMLNKPSGYISSTASNDGTPVTALIKERNDLFPVGRLDKNTEGLIILTNDGELAHNLTSPKHDVVKKYYVETEREIDETYISKFENGIDIIVDGSNYITKPSKIELVDKCKCYVYITEGKFHQVKEMFRALENKVIYLKRVAEGTLSLDDNLKIGEYRELTMEEIEKIKAVK